MNLKKFFKMEKENTEIKIVVKKDGKEVRVEMPWSVRTASLEVREGTTPRGILDMVEEMVEQLNKLK